MKANDFEIGSVVVNKISNNKYVVIGILMNEAPEDLCYDRTIKLADFDDIENNCNTTLPINLMDTLVKTIKLNPTDHTSDIEKLLECWELDVNEIPFNFTPINSHIVTRKKKVVTYI